MLYSSIPNKKTNRGSIKAYLPEDTRGCRHEPPFVPHYSRAQVFETASVCDGRDEGELVRDGRHAADDAALGRAITCQCIRYKCIINYSRHISTIKEIPAVHSTFLVANKAKMIMITPGCWFISVGLLTTRSPSTICFYIC